MSEGQEDEEMILYLYIQTLHGNKKLEIEELTMESMLEMCYDLRVKKEIGV